MPSNLQTSPNFSPNYLISTGVAGLDNVLGGGLPRDRMYLVQGDPGVGKTTLALQFLREGARRGERCLYVTLSETREELHAVARSHGFDLDGIEIHEMSAAETVAMRNEEENTLYAPAEIELGERMQALLEEVDRVKPERVVLDSCSELRLLSQSPLRFRRQLLALKADLSQRHCTILLLENPVAIDGDPLLQSLVHGVICMEQLSPLYGAARRRLRVIKLRESNFRAGYHDMSIEQGGVAVFPRLVAAEHHERFTAELVSSGVAQLDALLSGGLDRGTSVLFMGPAGSGKSVLSQQYLVAEAARDRPAVLYSFDEGLGTLHARAAALGSPLPKLVEAGLIRIHQVDPAELTPGQFAHRVRRDVEQHGVRLVVIDSLNGYLHAMPEESFLVAHLHELLSYLRQQGVLTIMVVAEHGFLGQMKGGIDVSYLADTVLVTRFFEAEGCVRKAISVVKRRSGRHENTIHELSLSKDGVRVGEPLRQFRGVLAGTPVFESENSQLVSGPA
jgi:circadian clock protein KaiC